MQIGRKYHTNENFRDENLAKSSLAHLFGQLIISFHTSIFLIHLAISINRLIAVISPTKYTKTFTKWTSCRIVFLAVIVNMFLSIPIYFSQLFFSYQAFFKVPIHMMLVSWRNSSISLKAYYAFHKLLPVVFKCLLNITPDRSYFEKYSLP